MRRCIHDEHYLLLPIFILRMRTCFCHMCFCAQVELAVNSIGRYTTYIAVIESFEIFCQDFPWR